MPRKSSGHSGVDWPSENATSSDNSTSPASRSWSVTAPAPTSSTYHPSSNSSASGGNGSAGEYGSTPAFVVYTDRTSNAPILPAASEMEGYTVVALSFLLLSGAADQALGWQSLSDSDKHAFKEDYNSAGISIIVSAFGSSDAPTSTNADPVDTANTMAQWVLDNQLDGIDVDYEDLNAMDARDGKAEKWIVTFTQTLRQKLPKGHYLLTHAPVAPWFSPKFNTTGAYITVDQQAGDLIDWYNVQFYNQGDDMYTTCDGLLNTSGSAWLGSSLNEIASAGIPLDKLVIGKYASNGDGANGYMDAQTLAQCVAQAKQQGWNAGIMFWEYPDADADLIKTVRGSSFPL
ncbi:glycoside hydrolase family 18 protein [Trametes coccinea BRFM310]|uniref:Glycoside hydrolase family 18 protein n=1 Tax=Trametes coccinea (strain BRFM310) TaxID=1353009 RepID=A0A1Y2J027_TRAC3|nr:glycoside hydrolase family 18 protein [Trametes coccinea BRFM310]